MPQLKHLPILGASARTVLGLFYVGSCAVKEREITSGKCEYIRKWSIYKGTLIITGCLEGRGACVITENRSIKKRKIRHRLESEKKERKQYVYFDRLSTVLVLKEASSFAILRTVTFRKGTSWPIPCLQKVAARGCCGGCAHLSVIEL